jgi:hypothetical protein
MEALANSAALLTYSCGDLDSWFLFPFIIHKLSFKVCVNKGVLMHNMKFCKPEAAGRGICNVCHAPKLFCFKGTLKGNNKPILQIRDNCGFIFDFANKKVLKSSFRKQ